MKGNQQAKGQSVKRFQFSFSDFNPDGMTPDELMEWINFIGTGLRPRIAKQWFPDRKGQFRLVRLVRNYCWNKITAIELRLVGKVQDAIQYENICDRIYADLPADLRW